MMDLGIYFVGFVGLLLLLVFLDWLLAHPHRKLERAIGIAVVAVPVVAALVVPQGGAG